MNENIQVPIDKGLKKEIEIVSKKIGLSMAEFLRRGAMMKLSRYYIGKEALEQNIINEFINKINLINKINNENIQVPIDKGLKKEIETVAKKLDLSMAEFLRRGAMMELSRYYIKREELERNIINEFINEINKEVK